MVSAEVLLDGFDWVIGDVNVPTADDGVTVARDILVTSDGVAVRLRWTPADWKAFQEKVAECPDPGTIPPGAGLEVQAGIVPVGAAAMSQLPSLAELTGRPSAR